jgi:ectoine hydroxylase-related dioxygenase (phytanoyl-CoA dioxygenase family)
MSAATISDVTGAIERYTDFTISDPHAPADELRAQFDRDSYLFFRNLVPAEVVMEVRRDALELCREAGWLDPDRDLMDGIVGPGVTPTSEGKPDYMAMYRKLLKLPSFRAFPSQPVLIEMARTLLGGEVLVHPRRIGRVTFPNNTVATVPPHQDWYYIRGTIDTYTAWIPLGECSKTLGGLAVWPGSHHKGYLDHTQHVPGAIGGCGIPVDGMEIEWHTIDFEVGDVLLFHSHSIHKALPNLSGNQLRISTDNRYQRADDSIDPSSLKQHFGFDDD